MKRHETAGFTLIELMTVVAVVAILAAIAYPSYQEHLRKAKRAEGKAALLRAAQVLERYYSDRSTYATTPRPPLTPTNIDLAVLFALAEGKTVHSGENAEDIKSPYTITAAAPDPTNCPKEACYLITATPNAPFTDPTCGSFTLTSTGTRCWSITSPPDPSVVTTCTPTPANADTCKW